MLQRKFSDRPFESQLLLALVIIGFMRILAGMLQDFLDATSVEGLMIDIVLLFLFGAIAYLAFTQRNFYYVHPLVGFFLIFLVSLLFIRSGGVEGTGEFNFFMLAVMLTLLFHNRWQRVLLILMFVMFIYLSYSIYVKNIVFEYLFVRNSQGYENFLFTLVALAILIAYLQLLIETEEKRLVKHNKALQIKVSMLRNKNSELMQQQPLLAAMHEQLLTEARERKIYLEQKNKAIQLYIEQNTKQIQQPIDNLRAVIMQVDDRYPKRYKEMLDASLKEICVVSDSIKKAISSEQVLRISSTQWHKNEEKS